MDKKSRLEFLLKSLEDFVDDEKYDKLKEENNLENPYEAVGFFRGYLGQALKIYRGEGGK